MNHRCLLALIMMLAAATGAFSEYRTVEIESLKITIDSDWAQQGSPGYLPIRFDIANLGDARQIEIVGRGQRWAPYSGLIDAGIDIRQTLRLNRGDRVHLTLPVPVNGYSENIQFQVHEGNRTLETFNYVAFRSSTGIEDTPVLIIADRSGPLGAVAPSWLRSTSARGSLSFTVAGSVRRPSGSFVAGPPGAPLDFIIDPARTPSSWLSFTSLLAVLIGPKEWEQLSEPQKQALLAWTAGGGDLMFVGGELKQLLQGSQNHGAVKTDAKAAATRYFFGHIYFPTSAEITTNGLDATLSMTRSAVQEPGLALPANRAPSWNHIAERGFRLLIPGVNGIPARAFFWILFFFTILIWPVNYFFLFRRRLQALLVLTVPLVSGLFVVVLAAYAIGGEGFGVHGRATTFTILDQSRRQAATRASVSLYAAGMAPSGGLRFPRDVAVIPIGTDGQGSREPETLNLTDLQQFSSGIVRARVPANFEEIRVTPVRERLSFTRDGGHISVTNGLGVNVAQLRYRDGGTLYVLNERLQPGERRTLQAAFGPGEIIQFWEKLQAGERQTSQATRSGALPALLSTLVQSGVPSPEIFQRAVNSQPDGSYIALLDRSPFWEPGLANLDERGSFHFMLGFVEGEP
jgi:hypothetical protein